MASVLVHEHDEHVRSLLVAQLAALGHEALLPGERGDWRSSRIDVALIEPATPPGLRLARHLRAERPHLPLVIASVRAPSDDTRMLLPAAHVVKPFRLADLGRALEAALSLRFVCPATR